MKIKQVTIFIKGLGLTTLNYKDWVEYCTELIKDGDVIEIVEVNY